VNNGDNDAAPENQPSQFILIRGLEGSVNEDLLAKGVAKLYRPAGGNSDNATNTQKKAGKVASTTGDANLGAREGSIRRVLLVRDRRTNESWRYGFAEFANVMVCRPALPTHPAPLTVLYTGCPSCYSAVEFFRQVHHLIPASPC
jgi:hypothetical protein